jgi:hypothetical protein
MERVVCEFVSQCACVCLCVCVCACVCFCVCVRVRIPYGLRRLRHATYGPVLMYKKRSNATQSTRSGCRYQGKRSLRVGELPATRHVTVQVAPA